MSILSGYNKYKRYIKTSDGYKLVSQWTSSNTVEMNDGNTVETNLGAIQGLTSSLATDNDNYALSASAGKSLQDQVTELNSNLYNEDSYTIELINNSNYTVAGNGIKEYARNGITTLVIGALKCTTPSSSWAHCGTLISKPLSELYFNLLTWEDTAPYKINCKIDVEGKVYFRYGVATTSAGNSINYYGTVTFS